MFTALQTGAIDAFVAEAPLCYGAAAKSDDPKNWRVIEPGIDAFQQAMPMRPNVKFKAVADLAVVELFASGEWQKLYDKYFGPKSEAPIPMSNIVRVLSALNKWPA